VLNFSGQLDANVYRQCASHHPIEKHHASPDDNIGNLQRYFNVAFSSTLSDGSENILFDYDEKIEEDRKGSIISQKKNVENAHISSALFYSWYNKFFFLSNIKVLHFSKHLSHFSYHKLFIVFQVFRI
jgi:hypothetical protein